MMKLIDIHAHLNFPQFDGDRGAVIERVKQAGVGVINVGTDLATSQQAAALSEKYENMWATVGLHPHDVDQGFDIKEFTKLARQPQVVAIGECGLDYGRKPISAPPDPTRIQNQKEILAAQIELAIAVGKPLMIHCRNAYADLFNFLVSDFDIHNSNVRGVMHFWAGNWAEAKQFLDLGFSLSFAGPITFAHDYDEVIKNTPLDRILSETDSPFAAPVPYRGRRNEPVYVREVLKKIAQLKNLAEEQAAAAILQNARHLLLSR